MVVASCAVLEAFPADPDLFGEEKTTLLSIISVSVKCLRYVCGSPRTVLRLKAHAVRPATGPRFVSVSAICRPARRPSPLFRLG